MNRLSGREWGEKKAARKAHSGPSRLAYDKPAVAIFNIFIFLQFNVYIYATFFILIQFNIYIYAIFLYYFIQFNVYIYAIFLYLSNSFIIQI